MKRDDFTEAIKIPLAIIPGGSGNFSMNLLSKTYGGMTCTIS